MMGVDSTKARNSRLAEVELGVQGAASSTLRVPGTPWFVEEG